MSYERISETRPVGRKPHICIWCIELIEKGTRHVHEVSKYYGELQDHRWHLDCHAAMQASYDYGEDNEFDPHSHKRGTVEER